VPRPDARIAAALARRLDEVERRLPEDSVPEAAEVRASADPEESLRLVMVRLWPPVAAGDATSERIEALVDGLLAIRTQAAGDDLRYLDAWNNAYEALTADAGLLATAAARRLLTTYADLLRGQIRRLAA
jgi:hypothetical protein